MVRFRSRDGADGVDYTGSAADTCGCLITSERYSSVYSTSRSLKWWSAGNSEQTKGFSHVLVVDAGPSENAMIPGAYPEFVVMLSLVIHHLYISCVSLLSRLVVSDYQYIRSNQIRIEFVRFSFLRLPTRARRRDLGQSTGAPLSSPAESLHSLDSQKDWVHDCLDELTNVPHTRCQSSERAPQ